MLRLAIAVLLLGCGRLHFAPIGDDANEADGLPADGMQAGPCVASDMVIPGFTPASIRIARLTNGWAIGFTDMATNLARLVVVDDTNMPSAPVRIASNGFMLALAANQTDIAIGWGAGGMRHLGRFAYDGSPLGSAVTVPAADINDLVWTGSNFAMLQTNAGVVSVQDIDAMDQLGAVHQVVTGATVARQLSTHDGYGVLWVQGMPLALHLSGLDAAGNITLADQTLASGVTGTSMVWTGTRHVALWGLGAALPQITSFDANWNVLDPITALAMPNQSQPALAWNGSILGTARLEVVANQHEIAFRTIDSAGGNLSNDSYFGKGVAGGYGGPSIAAGPARFAFAWPTTNPNQLHFAVVCL